MKTVISLVVVSFAVLMMSCGGNANKPKEVVEEAVVEVVDTVACCNQEVCCKGDATICAEGCKCCETCIEKCECAEKCIENKCCDEAKENGHENCTHDHSKAE